MTRQRNNLLPLRNNRERRARMREMFLTSVSLYEEHYADKKVPAKVLKQIKEEIRTQLRKERRREIMTTVIAAFLAVAIIAAAVVILINYNS